MTVSEPTTTETKSAAASTPVVVTTAVVGDVESQQKSAAQPVVGSVAVDTTNDDAGKGMGIAMFVLLLVAFVFGFIPVLICETMIPFFTCMYEYLLFLAHHFLLVFAGISLICVIIAIVLASIITCSCCCASASVSFHKMHCILSTLFFDTAQLFSSCIQDYNLKPNVKKFATATLVSLCLSFIIQIIYFIAVLMVAGAEASSTGTVSQETTDGAWAGAGEYGISLKTKSL